MKKKQPKTSRRAADSDASPRRSERGTTRPAKGPFATKQTTTKSASHIKSITRSGSSPRKRASGSRAPVARVSFQHQRTLTTHELQKVVGDLLRDELKNTAQWLLQQCQFLFDRYLGDTSVLSRDATSTQIEGGTINPALDAAEPQGDASASGGDATNGETTQRDSDSSTSVLPIDTSKAAQLAVKVRNLTKDAFNKYEPLEYLLLAYAKKALTGTDVPFFQTDTRWKSARSRKRACEELLNLELITGFGPRIEIAPELIQQGKRKSDHRYQGHQITDLGIAVLRVVIPWVDEMICDIDPPAAPETQKSFGLASSHRRSWARLGMRKGDG